MPNKVRAWRRGGGRYRQEDEAREGLMGVKRVEKQIQKKHYVGGVQVAP